LGRGIEDVFSPFGMMLSGQAGPNLG
jgi:hypothetical protein